MDEKTTGKGSLDDSLTSIQWLCQLESDNLVETKSYKKPEPAASSSINRPIENNNPYPKPQYSYASLIVLAINSAKDKRMTLQQIYAWIEDKFPFYKHAKKGWKNSIRHNLSLHKFFIKEQRADVLYGKGSFWRISPEGKENLLRDILKPSASNLRPPMMFLPHDPNSKLRHILPKPCLDAAKLQYVPMLDFSVPIVLVPSTTESENQMFHSLNVKSTHDVAQNCYVNSSQQGPVHTFAKSETVVIDSGSQYPMSFSQPAESADELNVGVSDDGSLKETASEAIPTKVSSKTPTNGKRRRKSTSCEPKETSLKEQSNIPKSLKRVPNILRRNKKFRIKSPDKQESKIHTLQSETVEIDSGSQNPMSFSQSVENVDELNNGACEGGSLRKTTSEAVETKVSSKTPAKCKSRRKSRSRNDPKETSLKEQLDESKFSKPVPNILRRDEMFRAKSPEKITPKMQTPLKNAAQSTLAEINCSNDRTPRSPNGRVDDFANIFGAPGASPLGRNRSFEFLRSCFGSPGISPLRSPVCFSSGFTPPTQGDCEAEFLSTPIRSCLADLSFNNWTPLHKGFTPISNNTPNSNCTSNQRCRKSLSLEPINELNESISKTTW
ncbi:forkhead box protein N3-like [Dendronephthya gigantea]|uniref:forkhead box protein N3-like n=1 Tax=Dendronephthya gigantea TaxID=151771 RepID=UPI00106D113D|nr:forkhead box protein N3-like [Dendronephthya gigantea]